MSVLELRGARYYAEPGEHVVTSIESSVTDVLGIVTRRPNGFHYASVIRRKDYGNGIAEWGELKVLQRSIVATPEEGVDLVRQVLSRMVGEPE